MVSVNLFPLDLDVLADGVVDIWHCRQYVAMPEVTFTETTEVGSKPNKITCHVRSNGRTSRISQRQEYSTADPSPRRLTLNELGETCSKNLRGIDAPVQL